MNNRNHSKCNMGKGSPSFVLSPLPVTRQGDRDLSGLSGMLWSPCVRAVQRTFCAQNPSPVPSSLSLCLPLLLLAGSKPRHAGSEILPAAHNHPVRVQVPCLGLNQSFFHEEIALGTLSHGKTVHTVFNNLWKGSIASQVSSWQLQPEKWVSKTRTDGRGLT